MFSLVFHNGGDALRKQGLSLSESSEKRWKTRVFWTPNLTLKILALPFVESKHAENALRSSARFLGLSAEESKNRF